MKAKPLMIGLSLLVVLVAALAAFLWYRETTSAEQKLADTLAKNQFVFGEYFNGDYGTAKSAMLAHILLLDRLSAESDNPSRNPYSVDAMAWFVRLAKLEERNDGTGRAEYMREACIRCEKLERADCSEQYLSQQTDRMDTIGRSGRNAAPNYINGR